MQQIGRGLAALLLAGAMLQPCPALAMETQARPNAMVAGWTGSPASAAIDAARVGDLSAAEQLLSQPGVAGPDAALLRAQLHAARAEDGLAQAALRDYLSSGDPDPQRLAVAHEIAAELAFARGRYADAARHAADFLPLARQVRPSYVDEIQQMLDIARLLENEPGQRLEARGGSPAPAAPDKVGLLRTAIHVGGFAEDAVLDTGANLSVATESAARRMGLRMLDGVSSVGNSVGTDVAVRLGIAERLEIAGTVLSNVVFLVMEDDQLSFSMVPGGYRIDAIVGLPVFRALGRVRFGPGDSFGIAEPAGDGPGRGNLRLVGSSPFVLANVAGVEVPLYFDTGATGTSLHPAFAQRHGALALRDSGRREGRAGAGGDVTHLRSAELENVDFALAGGAVTLPEITVELEDRPDGEGHYGVLGNDMVGKFDSFLVDFDRMEVLVTPAPGAGS